MSRKKNPVLSDKHLKALELIGRTDLKLKDVANAVGWKPDYLYDLYEGNTSKAGSVASLFSAECKKIDKEIEKRIKELLGKNKSLAMSIIHRVLNELDQKPKLVKEDKFLVKSINDSLAKSTPKVEIGSVAYSYTQGYTAEQLIYEFQRLQSVT